MNSSPHLTLDQLRVRPQLSVTAAGGQTCPVSRTVTIKPKGQPIRANGKAPFYFGPWGGLPVSAGDFNKTPWMVDIAYSGGLLIRGHRLDGPGQVGFGFWPPGFGMPAQQEGVGVLFSRPDRDGRTVVYQPELDVSLPAGGQSEGHYWSFPAAGCYAIQVDGDRFSNVTVVLVRLG
jgi:hypothetical protein